MQSGSDIILKSVGFTYHHQAPWAGQPQAARGHNSYDQPGLLYAGLKNKKSSNCIIMVYFKVRFSPGPRPLGKADSLPPREVPGEDGQRDLAARQEGALRPLRLWQAGLSWRVFGQGHPSHILCHLGQAHQVLRIPHLLIGIHFKVHGSSESSGSGPRKFHWSIDSHPRRLSCEYAADKAHLKTVISTFINLFSIQFLTELFCLMKNRIFGYIY